MEFYQVIKFPKYHRQLFHTCKKSRIVAAVWVEFQHYSFDSNGYYFCNGAGKESGFYSYAGVNLSDVMLLKPDNEANKKWIWKSDYLQQQHMGSVVRQTRGIPRRTRLAGAPILYQSLALGRTVRSTVKAKSVVWNVAYQPQVIWRPQSHNSPKMNRIWVRIQRIGGQKAPSLLMWLCEKTRLEFHFLVRPK